MTCCYDTLSSQNMIKMTRARVATSFCLIFHWVESRVLPTIPQSMNRPHNPPSQLTVCIIFKKISRAFG